VRGELAVAVNGEDVELSWVSAEAEPVKVVFSQIDGNRLIALIRQATSGLPLEGDGSFTAHPKDRESEYYGNHLYGDDIQHYKTDAQQGVPADGPHPAGSARG
jgi:hypothetical protein